MDFAGFERGLQDRFNSWELPDRIVREFNLRIIHDLSASNPIELPRSDRKIIFRIDIQDAENPETYYWFSLHIHMTDDMFWVCDVTGFGHDADDNVIWHSPS
jgi:hypothetical protein